MIKNNGFIIGRQAMFQGRRKVGLDTNVFIRIFEQPFLLETEASKIFNYSDILYTHAICKWQLIKKLKKKHSEDEAKRIANDFIQGNNINIIYPKDCYITEEEYLSFQKMANEEFKKRGMEDSLKCHPPDSIIILAFKKCNINRIISTDESFRESAKLQGIDGSGLPSFNYLINKQLKKLYGYSRTKKWKRKRN